MPLTRKDLLDSFDILTGFMSKDIHPAISLPAGDIYNIIAGEVKKIELFNASQLVKHGTRNDEKQAYEILPSNPNYAQFMQERNMFLAETIEFEQFTPIKTSVLFSYSIQIKPIEALVLKSLGIIVE